MAIALLGPFKTYLKEPIDPRKGSKGCPANGGNHPVGRDFPGGYAAAKKYFNTIPDIQPEDEWDGLAIQHSINSAYNERNSDPKAGYIWPRTGVILRPGMYVTNRELVIRGVMNPIFSGSGRGNTWIAFNPNTPRGPLQSVFTVDGCMGGYIGDFSIRSQRPGEYCEIGFNITWSPASMRSTSGLYVARVDIGDMMFKYGFGVGAVLYPGHLDQVDNCSFFSCNVAGPGDRIKRRQCFAGWKLGIGQSANNILHHLDNCHGSFVRYGYHIDGSSATIRNTLPGGAETDFYFGALTGPSSIYNCRTEGSYRFIEESYGSGPAQLSIRDVSWNGNVAPEGETDDQGFPWEYCCLFHHEGQKQLDNVALHTRPGQKIKWRFSAPRVGVISARNMVLPVKPEELVDVFAPSNAVNIAKFHDTTIYDPASGVSTDYIEYYEEGVK